jgi:hypothetical protein
MLRPRGYGGNARRGFVRCYIIKRSIAPSTRGFQEIIVRARAVGANLVQTAADDEIEIYSKYRK